MSSSPLNIKSGRTVSAAHMRLHKHQVKQPQLHRPTNYSAVYLELMACILWSCPMFILIRQFRPREGESQLGAHLGLTKRTWLHRSMTATFLSLQEWVCWAKCFPHVIFPHIAYQWCKTFIFHARKTSKSQSVFPWYIWVCKKFWSTFLEIGALS